MFPNYLPTSKVINHQISKKVLDFLFSITFLFCFFLALYTPWKFWLETETRIELDHFDVISTGFFIVVLIALFTGVRMIVLYVLSYITVMRRDNIPTLPANKELPFVSILVPAYEEQECIASALQSLSELDYPSYEVIVIDDGSRDNTFELAKCYEGDYFRNGNRCKITVLRKKIQGNGALIIMAFDFLQAPWFYVLMLIHALSLTPFDLWLGI